MAERVRDRDWSGTAVGPAQRWPQSLQTALSICLSSRFPLHVWWGPELTVFYNDAYVPAIGRQAPRRSRAGPRRRSGPRSGTSIGPMAASVLAGRRGHLVRGPAAVPERHGYLEETYYTFSYSPIQDDERRGRRDLLRRHRDDRAG